MGLLWPRTQAVGAAVFAMVASTGRGSATPGTCVVRLLEQVFTALGWGGRGGGLAGKRGPSSVSAEHSWILLNALQFVASLLIDLQGL